MTNSEFINTLSKEIEDLNEANVRAADQLDYAWKHLAAEVTLHDHPEYLRLGAAMTVAAAINNSSSKIVEALGKLTKAVKEIQRD